jgi:hypothetical protein
MKYLLLIALVALISALTMRSNESTVKVDEQLECSHHLHDSAMLILNEIAHTNDSLVDVYFPIKD